MAAIQDGETSSPTTFKGQIGRLLDKCDQSPVLRLSLSDFERIPNELFLNFDKDVRKDLSKDQMYLNICNVIRGAKMEIYNKLLSTRSANFVILDDLPLAAE